MLASVIDIEIHLADVCGRELLKLEVNQNQGMQTPVEEHQIHPVPLVIDAQPLLTANERKVVAELEQETFHVPDEGIFQFGLGIFIFQFEKLEHERVFQLLLGRGHILGPDLAPLVSMLALFFDSAVRS